MASSDSEEVINDDVEKSPTKIPERVTLEDDESAEDVRRCISFYIYHLLYYTFASS
jgi:hypothetical protein